MLKLNITADFPFGIWQSTCCITELKNIRKETGQMSVMHLKYKHSEAIRNFMLLWEVLLCDWELLNPNAEENT